MNGCWSEYDVNEIISMHGADLIDEDDEEEIDEQEIDESDRCPKCINGCSYCLMVGF